MLKIISMFIGILILGIGEVIFGKIVLDEEIKVSKLKLFLILIFTSIIYTSINFYLTGATKTILLWIIHIFEFKIIFKIEYLKATILMIEYSVLMLLT